jgi:signal transduction histidine kinase
VTERKPPGVERVPPPQEPEPTPAPTPTPTTEAAAPAPVAEQPTAAYPLVIPPPAAEPAADVAGLAGEVAVEVARQLAEPVRALRDRLGLVVDHIERHVATSTGPTPYSWRSLQALRQELAATYLEATSLARRLDELDRALREDPAGWLDPAAAVELGLHLAGHHLGAGIELLIDLGNTPPARGLAGTVALLVAQLVAASARSARDLPGSTVSVRVADDGGCALIAIADNGAGSTRAAALGELARGLIAPWGGTVDAASLPGAGCTFEIRLATDAPA